MGLEPGVGVTVTSEEDLKHTLKELCHEIQLN